MKPLLIEKRIAERSLSQGEQKICAWSGGFSDRWHNRPQVRGSLGRNPCIAECSPALVGDGELCAVGFFL